MIEMEENSSGTLGKKQKALFILGAVIIVALIAVIILLSVNSKNQTQAYEATMISFTAIAESIEDGQVAAVVEATATPTPLPATESPTEESVTATMTETVASAPGLTADGLKIYCLPNDFDLAISSSTVFTNTQYDIRKATIHESAVEVVIPVKACAVFATFTQPLSNETSLEIFQASDPNPWLSEVLMETEQEDGFTYFAVLDHPYIIDPPYWNLTYTMKIKEASQLYWEGSLDVSRAFAGLCWEGSVPDPVTLKCPQGDKLEREPHSDMPTLVPGGLSK
jgi:hypothetical protein